MRPLRMGAVARVPGMALCVSIDVLKYLNPHKLRLERLDEVNHDFDRLNTQERLVLA